MRKQPNIVIIMADDLGWGQTSYAGHPYVSTPNIDALSANGVRFDRFYVSGLCGPARAQIQTGRVADRGGIHKSFYKFRKQEKTVAQALKNTGYTNGMFGKWHLNGMIGNPGAPMLPEDPRHPGYWGFDEWVASTCGIDPYSLMGDHNGNILEHTADSSSAIAAAANDFIDRAHQSGTPFFAHVCMSSPHTPYHAIPTSKALYEGLGLSTDAEHLFGMITELDAAVGSIRQKLRDLGIEKDTVVWFLSDNGGNSNTDPDQAGGLRGKKGDPYEGGVRVPCSVEWPGRIQPGRISKQMAWVADIPLTLCELANANPNLLLKPQDGISICGPLLDGEEIENRAFAIHRLRGTDDYGVGIIVSDRWKALTHAVRGVAEWELYDVQADVAEATDLAEHHPDIVSGLADHYWTWLGSVRRSLNGLDYPEGRVTEPPTGGIFWTDEPIYAGYIAEWSTRPEYIKVFNDASGFAPGNIWYDNYHDIFRF